MDPPRPNAPSGAQDHDRDAVTPAEPHPIEFEDGRRIAWQSRPSSGIGAKVAGGRIWRYELEPVEGGTRVRETWDISQERVKALVQPARKRTIAAMEATLGRIEEIVSAT